MVFNAAKSTINWIANLQSPTIGEAISTMTIVETKTGLKIRRVFGLLWIWSLGGILWVYLLFAKDISIGEILGEVLVILVSLSMVLELNLRKLHWQTWLGWLFIVAAMLIDIEDSVWHSPRTALLDRFDIEEFFLLSGCLFISFSFMQLVARLQRISFTDELTKLGNRRAFFAEFSPANTEQSSYLAYVDLDRFKQVNDTLGHDIGDQLLREFSATLTHVLQDNECAYRLGGDEFVFVVMGEPDTIKARIESIKSSLNTALSRYKSGVSLGVVRASKADTADQLLHMADQKMYEDKQCICADKV